MNRIMKEYRLKAAVLENGQTSTLDKERCKPFLLAVLVAMVTIIGSFSQTILAQTTQPIDRPEELQILDSYFRIAVEQNPELSSLRYEVAAQRQRSPQAEALPDPEMSAGFFLNPVNDAGFLSRFSVSAMQMFPWFGTLDARGNVEKSIADGIGHTLTARQFDIFREIQDLWYTYYKLNHHVHVNREILRIVRELESLVETRYETGRAGQADILRLQIEEQRLLNTIERLEDEKNPVRVRLNAVLNREPAEEIHVPVQLPTRILAWSKEELLAFARNRHPQFSRLDSQRSQFNNRLELARLEGRPSFGIGLEYMGRDFSMLNMMPEMKETFIGMATVRIPLYRSKYRAQRQEARFRLQATDELETDITNRFQADIESAMKSFRDGQRAYQLITDELLPRAEQILEILLEEYSTGQVRFDELLEVIRELLALENEKIEALAKQNEAMADIEQLIGNELPGYE
ncbi:MAG: TolC family protein [Balneolaceae bacterium]